jgi:urease accessory protein
LAHPLLGPDHLLALVAVGLLAALTGGTARYAYPSAFVGGMLVGGALGFGGPALPFVEPTILASVVALGAATAFALHLPLAAACAAIAAFGLAHGYVHGLEGPALGGLPYAFGFVLSTVALHGLGLVLGLAARNRGPVLGRALGGVTCLAGVAMAIA